MLNMSVIMRSVDGALAKLGSRLNGIDLSEKTE